MKRTYKLFFFLPILQIKKSPQTTRIKLFAFLPIYERHTSASGRHTVYKTLDIPVWKISKKVI